jgi:hypothetical protein
MTVPSSVLTLAEWTPVLASDHAVGGRNLRRFLLQRNIKIGKLLTFSRACPRRYNEIQARWYADDGLTRNENAARSLSGA